MKDSYLREIEKIEEDIKAIKIQGATNVALATLEGIRLVVESGEVEGDKLISEVKKVGEKLALARKNEPLARNAMKYILHKLSEKDSEKDFKKEIVNYCKEYKALIERAKKNIITNGTGSLRKEKVVLTHCHSSTSTSTLINVAKFKSIVGEEFKVVATETRPRYQGRKTAKELYEAGVDVTMIVDSACSAFIIDDRYLPVGAIIVGCDELLRDGSFINKVGTHSIAVAAQKGADEFYVATTLLKLNAKKGSKLPEIEQRDVGEVWEEAPEGLKIINPAFDFISKDYVTGYITEVGVLESKDLVKKAREFYSWLVDN